jgi:threonine/homoserine/homoserine lactone efflux protein
MQNYSSFIAAIVVFQLIPGPGTLQPHRNGR